MTDNDALVGGGDGAAHEPLDSTMNFTTSITEVPADRGADVSVVTDEASRAIAALPAGSALLVVQRGPNSGARFLLDTESTVVGRDPNCSIFLDDVTVSRQHAEYLIADNGFIIRDLGSLNGTYVNRQRVDQATLTSGDEVQIGKYRMTFHPGPPAYDHSAASSVGGGDGDRAS